MGLTVPAPLKLVSGSTFNNYAFTPVTPQNVPFPLFGAGTFLIGIGSPNVSTLLNNQYF
jgi:hypothetical protein